MCLFKSVGSQQGTDWMQQFHIRIFLLWSKDHGNELILHAFESPFLFLSSLENAMCYDCFQEFSELFTILRMEKLWSLLSSPLFGVKATKLITACNGSSSPFTPLKDLNV